MRIESRLFRCGAGFIPAATFLFISVLPASLAEQVTLAWDANSEPDLAGYYVYYGEPGSPPARVSPGLDTTVTISGLLPGATYVFYATAFNTANLESDPSQSLTYTVPDPDPVMAAAPVFNPPGGAFTAPVQVSMTSSTPGAVIRYTLDGSTPTTTSTAYTTPITVDSTTTLSAITFSSGFLPSPVTTAEYTVEIPPSGTITFAGQDTSTKGTWPGTYGDLGYIIVGNATSLPPSIEITAVGHEELIWRATNRQKRSLRKAIGSRRIAASWSAEPEFTLQVEVNHSSPRALSIYFLDWERLGRSQLVEALDAQSGAILDSRTVSDFGGGKYLSWLVQGEVDFRFLGQGPGSAVLSGVFLD